MIPIVLAALLTLAQAAPMAPAPPVPPVPPAPPAAPAPPPPVFEESIELSGFLGLVPADVTRDEVMRLGLKEESGALVKEVVADGPAAKAGLKKDDVITRFGRTPVESAAQLRRLISETPPGRTVSLSIVRDRRSIEVSVTLGEPDFKIHRLGGPGRVYISGEPDDPRLRVIIEKELEGSREELERAQEEMELSKEEMEKALKEADLSRKEIEIYLNDADEGLDRLERLPPPRPGDPMVWEMKGGDDGNYRYQFHGMDKPRLGVGLQELTPQLAEYFGLKGRDGVLITSVNEGSPAAKAGLKAGDVILTVGGEVVEDAGDVREALSDVKEGPVDVKVLREKKEMSFKPVLERIEEKVIVREKQVKRCPIDGGGEKKVIVKVGEPGVNGI